MECSWICFWQNTMELSMTHPATRFFLLAAKPSKQVWMSKSWCQWFMFAHESVLLTFMPTCISPLGKSPIFPQLWEPTYFTSQWMGIKWIDINWLFCMLGFYQKSLYIYCLYSRWKTQSRWTIQSVNTCENIVYTSHFHWKWQFDETGNFLMKLSPK